MLVGTITLSVWLLSAKTQLDNRQSAAKLAAKREKRSFIGASTFQKLTNGEALEARLQSPTSIESQYHKLFLVEHVTSHAFDRLSPAGIDVYIRLAITCES